MRCSALVKICFGIESPPKSYAFLCLLLFLTSVEAVRHSIHCQARLHGDRFWEWWMMRISIDLDGTESIKHGLSEKWWWVWGVGRLCMMTKRSISLIPWLTSIGLSDSGGHCAYPMRFFIGSCSFILRMTFIWLWRMTPTRHTNQKKFEWSFTSCQIWKYPRWASDQDFHKFTQWKGSLNSAMACSRYVGHYCKAHSCPFHLCAEPWTMGGYSGFCRAIHTTSPFSDWSTAMAAVWKDAIFCCLCHCWHVLHLVCMDRLWSGLVVHIDLVW